MAKTLYQKIYDAHVVHEEPGQSPIIYIDRHLIHEVTTPQAFSGLREQNRQVHRPEKTLATMDHNVSTRSLAIDACGSMSETQLKTLVNNCEENNLVIFPVGNINQGIIHVMGPEQGFTLPGTTIVCGDSHTSTHGAFGALAFGIGTSEIEHVLATQTLKQPRYKTMKVEVVGKVGEGISAKDIILAIIGKTGTAGATGHVVEYCGEAIRDLSIEGRMTLCNMSIEFGAKAGMVAPDEKTIAYFKDKPRAPQGEDWDEAVGWWQTLSSDEGATFDKVITLQGSEIKPMVTWGTNPGQVAAVDEQVPAPEQFSDEVEASSCSAALNYMGIEAGQKISDIAIDKVFIGSCTNSRIEDLRAAADVVKGHKIAPGVSAIVVPGSGQVQKQAEQEGLDEVFLNAGFEWRLPGCSMCLGMNDDRLQPGERCASTSNRNFEGRQGRGSRTHLVSPEMAAAAAVAGHFIDFRQLESA